MNSLNAERRHAALLNMTSMAKLSGLFRREFTRLLAGAAWAVEIEARPQMYGTLEVIAATEPASQKQVSDIVMLHPSDMVAMIDHLERHGLVRRERDPSDRRRYRLTLTDHGRSTLERFDRLARLAEETVLSPLDPGERARLGELINKAITAVTVA